MQASPIHDFQRNTAFWLFVLVVTSAALLFLLEKLRALLIPVIWAFFFAIPILSFADRVESLVNRCLSNLLDRACGRARRGPVFFQHTPGQNGIHLDRHDAESAAAADALVQALSSRCSRRYRAATVARQHACCSRAVGCLGRVLLRFDRSFWSCLWGQRVKITQLQPERTDNGADSKGEEIGGLVEGRSYYVSSEILADGLLGGDTEATSLELHLFLDRHQLCPAVLEDDDRERARETRRGMLEIDQRTLMSWLLSMLVTFFFVTLLVLALFYLVQAGIRGVNANLGDYQKGVREMVDDIKDATKSIIPPGDWDSIQKQALDKLKDLGEGLAAVSLGLVEGFAGQLFLFFLYLMFWIFEPLPVNDPVAKVFKDYLALKTIVCLLFASIMAALLACLSCPLWPLYFFLTFLLNYIPEIGPILAGLLMLPAVLLDGGVSKRVRYMHGTVLVIGGLCAKILTGNVIEVDLYSRFGGEYMRTHPVVLFVFFTFCGYQLGTTGMFISIPILGAIKYSLVSQALPEQYLNPLLVLIEGDVWAPHRNRIERQKALRAQRREIRPIESMERVLS